MPKSILIPFRKSITDGFYLGAERSSVEGMYINLYQLIMTVPGERVYMPEFGIGIRKYLFAPANEIELAELRNRITEQVRAYLPYLAVSSVYVTYTPVSQDEPHHVKLVVVMNVKNIETSVTQQFLFTFTSNSIM